MTRTEINTVLAGHAKYMAGAAGSSRADLRDADLVGGDFYGADMRGANLGGANARSANFTLADLRNVNFAGAILRGATFDGANVRGASFRGADLRGASIASARLGEIRDDLEAILDCAPGEVPGLLRAIQAGRVDGSTYVGACCCLVGTIANLRGLPYNRVPGLPPNNARPAERWFFAIRRGGIPALSPIAAITEGWVRGWLDEHAARGMA